MPMPRTPRALAELKGRTRHDPQRYRGFEPESCEIGPPPQHLTPAVRSVWLEIVGLAPAGVVKAADTLALELLASLVAEFRESPAEFRTSRIACMVGLLGRFGLSPTDRAKLAIEPPKKPSADDFSEF
jgi:hypothetical protein